MARTDEQKEYHAEKERGYRRQRKAERDAALARFSSATSVLLKTMSVGELVNLILEVKED